MTIYERIKILRIKAGLSQAELAYKVGYNGRSAISKVEKGQRDISQSMISKYASVFGVSPVYLLTGSEPPAEIAETEEKPTPEREERAREFLDLFSKLPDDKKTFIIQAMKGLLEVQ